MKYLYLQVRFFTLKTLLIWSYRREVRPCCSDRYQSFQLHWSVCTECDKRFVQSEWFSNRQIVIKILGRFESDRCSNKRSSNNVSYHLHDYISSFWYFSGQRYIKKIVDCCWYAPQNYLILIIFRHCNLEFINSCCLFCLGLLVFPSVPYAGKLLRNRSNSNYQVGVGESAYATITPALLSDFYPQSKRNSVLTIFYTAIPYVIFYIIF